MAVSIYDVAKRAGVSISTVSRILNNSANVRPQKEQAVREALEYYQYQPNQFGRGLVMQRSNMIGICLQARGDNTNRSTFDSTYAMEVLRGVEQTLAGTPYDLLLLSEAGSSEETQARFQGLIQQHKVDGLIMTGLHRDLAGQISRIQEENSFPLVYIGKRQTPASCNVYANYQTYTMDMLTRLYQMGHRKVLMLSGWTGSRPGALDFLQSQLAQQLPDLSISVAQNKSESADSMIGVLRHYCLEQRYTAVWCTEMRLVGVLLNACAVLGIRVPEQLSVLAVEHILGEGAQYSPQISAYHVPAREMGKAAAELLLRQISQETEEPLCISRDFEPQYIERGSTAFCMDDGKDS